MNNILRQQLDELRIKSPELTIPHHAFDNNPLLIYRLICEQNFAAQTAKTIIFLDTHWCRCWSELTVLINDYESEHDVLPSTVRRSQDSFELNFELEGIKTLEDTQELVSDYIMQILVFFKDDVDYRIFAPNLLRSE